MSKLLYGALNAKPANGTQLFRLHFIFHIFSGDKSRGEMDSKQIRDFNGDKMLMSLLAGDVICRRYYEKIQE